MTSEELRKYAGHVASVNARPNTAGVIFDAADTIDRQAAELRELRELLEIHLYVANHQPVDTSPRVNTQTKWRTKEALSRTADVEPEAKETR